MAKPIETKDLTKGTVFSKEGLEASKKVLEGIQHLYNVDPEYTIDFIEQIYKVLGK